MEGAVDAPKVTRSWKRGNQHDPPEKGVNSLALWKPEGILCGVESAGVPNLLRSHLLMYESGDGGTARIFFFFFLEFGGS